MYDIKTKKFCCRYCDSHYKIDEIEEQFNNVNSIGASEYMETELNRCTSCGAELIMSSLDMSTACVFCGQSTICSENVEKRKNQII